MSNGLALYLVKSLGHQNGLSVGVSHHSHRTEISCHRWNLRRNYCKYLLTSTPRLGCQLQPEGSMSPVFLALTNVEGKGNTVKVVTMPLDGRHQRSRGHYQGKKKKKEKCIMFMSLSRISFDVRLVWSFFKRYKVPSFIFFFKKNSHFSRKIQNL